MKTQLDKAYEILNSKIAMLEQSLGENTNTQTIYEGATTFKFEVMFCNLKNKITTKIMTINTKRF